MVYFSLHGYIYNQIINKQYGISMVNQSTIETLLHPKHITKDIQTYILANYQDDLNQIKTVWLEYLSQDYWDSKNTRLSSFKDIDPIKLITEVLSTLVLICPEYIPLIQVCTAKQFKGLDKIQSIHTMAEILHCINSTELILWDITKDNTRIIKHNIDLPDELQNRIKHSCVLPPLITKPKKLRHNRDTPYQTIHNDSLVLGFKENYHDKHISLDVLNTLNNTPLILDTWVIDNYQRQFKYLTQEQFNELDEEDRDTYTNQKITYKNRKEQFEYYYKLLKDKTIYFHHKFDKRGRIYSQGYQFNIQGDSLDKASLNLKTKETVTGEL